MLLGTEPGVSGIARLTLYLLNYIPSGSVFKSVQYSKGSQCGMSYHKYCLESRSMSEEEAMTPRANVCFQVWKWSHHRDEALLQERAV